MHRLGTGRNLSIEELEGHVRPTPPGNATGLVRSIHDLRGRPVGTLSAWDLARLIGQDIGLRRTLPLAVEILRDTAGQQVATGWYDDDLLTAVLTRKSPTWFVFPEIAHEVGEVLGMLINLSPHLQRDVEAFHEERDQAKPSTGNRGKARGSRLR